MRIADLWTSLHLNRWHKNPALRGISDDVMAHSGRMAVLAMRIWPGDAQLVMDCIKHDLGETAGGDLCGEFKRNNPVLADILAQAEAAHVAQMGFDPASDDPRIDMLDKLDAFLTAKLHAPHIMASADWRIAGEILKGKIMHCLKDYPTTTTKLELLNLVEG